MPAGDVVPWAPFDLASIGALIAEPARTAILLSLMDASERPASELARIAHVTASTASEHLQKMVAGGLLATRAAGRNRFYRLANERVADAVESVARLQPLDQPR